MRRIVSGIFVAAALTVAAFDQAAVSQDGTSLGDVARANREKTQAQEAAGITPKVITNKDLPASDRSGIPAENPDDPMTQVSGLPRRVNPDSARPFRPPFEDQGGQGFGRQGFPGQGSGQGFQGHDGENLRSRIQEQESRIAELQARIDRANAMMHPYGSTAQFEGPTNRRQAMQAQRIETMQQMLDQQKQRLAAMQDAARREGAHTTVYDP
jgi:hypothetical protein